MSTTGEFPRYSDDKIRARQQGYLVPCLRRHLVCLLALFLAISAGLTVVYFSILTKEVVELQTKVNDLSTELAGRNVNKQPLLPSNLLLGSKKTTPRRPKREVSAHSTTLSAHSTTPSPEAYIPTSHLVARGGGTTQYKRIIEANEDPGILSWDESDITERLGFTNMIIEDNKRIKINVPGLYHVYSQVTYTFTASARGSAFWACGHEIRLKPHQSQETMALISSYITQPKHPWRKSNSVYQAGIFHLQFGDRLFVQLSRQCTNHSNGAVIPEGLHVTSNGETTFFGVFLFVRE